LPETLNDFAGVFEMYAGGRNTLPDCEAGISKSVNGEEADIQEKAGI
jgi:hypothetical protein